MGSFGNGALGPAVQKIVAKNNPDKFESYNEDTVAPDGTVKRKTLLRPKSLSSMSSLSSSTLELSDADYRKTTGRSRSTLLGG